MALLKRVLSFHISRWLASPLAVAVLLLGLLAGMLPVADTLWAEVLTVSGNIETGEWIFTETPTETATPTPTPTPHAQPGTTLEAYKTAEARWPEGSDGSTFIVTGQICVMNGGERSTEGLRIVDQVEIKPKRGTWQVLDGIGLEILPETQLAPGEVRCFDYELSVPYLQETAYRNTAQVTILNHSGWLPGGQHCPGPEPCPYGPQPRAEFSPPGGRQIVPGPTPPPPGDEEPPVVPPEPYLPTQPTPSLTPSLSPEGTPTPGESATATSSATLTPTPSPTFTETPIFVPTQTPTPNPAFTETPIFVPTQTPTPMPNPPPEPEPGS